MAAHFKAKIRTELVRRGQAAKLRCESIGDPPIDISWLKDKMPLYPKDEPRYSITKSQLLDGLLSELHIPETDRSDSALFTCITQNQYGNDDTNIQLLVQGPPDPPLDIRIYDYKSRSVQLSWVPGHTGNAPIQRYLITYAQLGIGGSNSSPNTPNLNTEPSSLYQSLHWVNISVPGNETNLLFAPLIPLTEYQFYMSAQNSFGYSRVNANEPIKFRTNDEAPSGPPPIVKAQATSSHSIQVRWRLPERRSHFGIPTRFHIGYKLLKSNQDSNNNNNNDEAEQQQQNLDNSPRSSQQITSTISEGKNPEYTYKTIELPAPPFVPDQNNLNWSSNNLSEQECQLAGLRRGQKYLIVVQASNIHGSGPTSEPLIVETWRFDVPDPPVLRLILRTSRSVHLAWRLNQPVAGSGSVSSSSTNSPVQTRAIARTTGEQSDSNQDSINEPITGFVLTRKQLPSSPEQADSSVVETKLPSDRTSQIVENLTCGTRYQFTLIAINSVGPSQPSDPLTVKTEGSAPVAPDKNSLLSLNSSSLMINLGAWHNGACPMRSFEVAFKPSRTNQWNQITNLQVNSAQDGIVSGNGTTGQLAQRSAQHAQSSQVRFGTRDMIGQHENSSNTTNQTIVLNHLTPALNYDLKIVATNEAGSTEAYYTFNTNSGFRLSAIGRGGSVDQQTLDHSFWPQDESSYRFSQSSLSELLSTPAPLISWILISFLMTFALSVVCIMFARRRRTSLSNCSLSLSSASRSNQSSSNYYETSAKTVTTGSTSCAPIGGESKQYASAALNMNESLGRGDYGRTGHSIDLYGQHQGPQLQQNSLLAPQYSHAQSSLSPQNGSDLVSVFGGNGSEAEMCLGASALNIGRQDTKQEDQVQSENVKSGRQEQHGATFYVSPMVLQQPQTQTLGRVLNTQHLSRSATLPMNHHQQHEQNHSHIHHNQQEQQQQQQQMVNQLISQNQQHQQMLESLVAANIFNQQSSCTHQNSPFINSSDQTNDGLNILEQQLQHQVYATVKRGCPKPPRLCDYAIYQCPNQSQNQTNEQRAALQSMIRCCSELQTQDMAVNEDTICYHSTPEANRQTVNGAQYVQPAQQLQQQQAQAMANDYQQLRNSAIN